MITRKTMLGYINNLLFMSVPLIVIVKILSQINTSNSFFDLIFLFTALLIFIVFFISAIAVIYVYSGVRCLSYENEILVVERHFMKQQVIGIAEIKNITETFKLSYSQRTVNIYYNNKKISILKYQFDKNLDKMIDIINSKLQ